MKNTDEIINMLDLKESDAVALELEIGSTLDQLQKQDDESHIIFLTDHIGVLQFELDKLHADIYLLRRHLKILENEEKFQPN